MTAQAVLLFLFLALIKDLSCDNPTNPKNPTNPYNPFRLESDPLDAVEGSCADLRCSVNPSKLVQTDDALWFWIKDAKFAQTNFTGTVIYSSDPRKRPVSPQAAGRVNYRGPSMTKWKNVAEMLTCSVLICNLSTSDSGVYAFRYIGGKKWMTDPNISLTVTENPCPLTLEKPSVVNDSEEITVRCSTLPSCTSDLQIQRANQKPLTVSTQSLEQKSLSTSFKVDWQDDGGEVSCQTSTNKDPYLIRKTSLSVQYAPREVRFGMSPGEMVREKQPVTLSCSAKGNPAPTFSWFVNGTKAYEGAVWRIGSITASQSGAYVCEAVNKLGRLKSDPRSIDVKYPPEVKVMTSSPNEVTEGEEITLTCNVTRSHPEPATYSWFRNSNKISESTQQEPFVKSFTPEDSGSYTCKVTNSAGTGTSAQRHIRVKYRPRKARISSPQENTEVKVGESLTFKCWAEAHPTPSLYSWSRFNKDPRGQTDPSQWKDRSLPQDCLFLERVQRTDEACYVCNASNILGTGGGSEPVCIKVLYPPTTPLLSMVGVVNEGQPTTIGCTVESSPPSRLTLRRTSKSSPGSSEVASSDTLWDFHAPNTLSFTFNATSAHYGFYTCEAKNAIGSGRSRPGELVVKYRPKDVSVKHQPSVVNENTLLKLDCSALSHPPVKSFSWTRMRNGKPETIGDTQSLAVKSAGPSDSGFYSCTAWNEMGFGKSPQVEIKVRYAPKLTEIIRGAEQQLPDGRRSETLSCRSQSYPEVTEFSWFMKRQDGYVLVSDRKAHTVYSDQPGEYYCTAKNLINQKSSEPVQVFVDRGLMKILIIFLLLVMLAVLLVLLVYRHRRKKSTQRGNSNTPSASFGSRGWLSSISRRSEPTMAEPFRSRDDLLTDPPQRPNGQHRHQPRPDNTSSATALYYTVNLPAGKQGRSGEKPGEQKARHTQDECLNYAAIHFKEKKQESDAVYAVVSKKKTPKKTGPENQEDYENLKTGPAANALNPPDYDSDTSEEEEEEEVELNYSRVSFKPNPGLQRADSSSTSSTSSEEETQYSQVKT